MEDALDYLRDRCDLEIDVHEPAFRACGHDNVMQGDTRPVRESEALDWPRLEAWLREAVRASDGATLDPREAMHVAQFPGGHSNLTYHVRFGTTELVVRRPPFGPAAGVGAISSGMQLVT